MEERGEQREDETREWDARCQRRLPKARGEAEKRIKTETARYRLEREEKMTKQTQKKKKHFKANDISGWEKQAFGEERQQKRKEGQAWKDGHIQSSAFGDAAEEGAGEGVGVESWKVRVGVAFGLSGAGGCAGTGLECGCQPECPPTATNSRPPRGAMR